MSVNPLSIKYRPKKLADVVGQEVSVQLLVNSFNDKNWHHTYILEGNMGCGKTSVARIMAAMENCEKGPTLEPCGECKNCQDIFSGKSQDVKEVDAASYRGIEDVRSLQEDARSCPLTGRVKYYIIDEAHSLTGPAAEAALKFIEEPPSYVRILLCTTDPQLLKPTIHSRCITLNFGKVNWLDIFNHLTQVANTENISYEEDALKFIAKISKGSVRNSLQGLQTAASFCGKEKITLALAQKGLGAIDNSNYFELMQNVISVNVPNAMLIIDKLMIQGRNSENIVKGITNHLRNLLLSRTCKARLGELGFTDDEAKRYIHQAEQISPTVVTKMMINLVDVQRAIAVNLDPQNYLEKFVLDSIIEVAKNSPKKEPNGSK